MGGMVYLGKASSVSTFPGLNVPQTGLVMLGIGVLIFAASSVAVL
jgi:hypothetical protein